MHGLAQLPCGRCVFMEPIVMAGVCLSPNSIVRANMALPRAAQVMGRSLFFFAVTLPGVVTEVAQPEYGTSTQSESERGGCAGEINICAA